MGVKKQGTNKVNGGPLETNVYVKGKHTLSIQFNTLITQSLSFKYLARYIKHRLTCQSYIPASHNYMELWKENPAGYQKMPLLSQSVLI